MARHLRARHKHAIAYCPRTWRSMHQMDNVDTSGRNRSRSRSKLGSACVEVVQGMWLKQALTKIGARIGPNAFERRHICIGHSPVPLGCGLVGFRLINWRTSGRRVTIPVPRGKKSRPTMFYNAKQSQSGLKISWKHARTSRTLLFPLL